MGLTAVILTVSASVMPPVARAADDLSFMATMNQSLEWQSNGTAFQQYAIYALTPGAEKIFTRLSDIESSKVADAGVYYDGKYYTAVVPTNSTYTNYTSTFAVYDTETWTRSVIATFGTGNGNIAIDMTVDYTTGTVYAIGTNVYNGSELQLKKVDLSTGEMTRIGALGANIMAIAADANGQLWGVGTPMGNTAVSNLYKIDKNTGAYTYVDHLDIKLYTGSLMSMTFDLRDGKLYLVAQTYTENSNQERTWVNALFTVDTATARTTEVRRFEYMEILAGLALRDSHPKAPRAPENLKFLFDAGSTTSGKVSCTLPALAYDGSKLTGELSVEVTVDGKTVAKAEGLTPGATYTTLSSIPLAEGSAHPVKVYCYTAGRKSLPARADIFSGTDTPAAPENLTVTLNDAADAIHISWDEAKSANGGYIDATALRYDVKLMPDATVIATGLTATELDHTFVNRNMGVGQIRVTARIGETASPDAVSQLFTAGTPWPVPYLEAFNYTGEAMWPFTVIDANGDESEYGFRWYFGPNNLAAWYYSTPTVASHNADDWLITPAIAFDTKTVYRLQFDTYGYMGGVNTLDIHVGSRPTVEKMARKIDSRTYETPGYSASQPLNIETLFVPQEGDCRVGFHNVGDNSDHTFIDNIYISAYGPTTIPGKVTDLTAASADKSVKLTFKAPTADAAGNPLTGGLTDIRIYRNNIDGDLLATIDAPAAGASLDFTDTGLGSGLKTYTVVASNADGRGLFATVSINTFDDVPQAVSKFTVTPRNSWTEALIEWEYPSSMTGVNGGLLSADAIFYDVYRTINGSRKTIAENYSGTSILDNGLAGELSSIGRRQIYVTYTIVPRTNGGEGRSTTSDQILMGLSYRLPFKESWRMQSQENYTWVQSNCASGSSWIICSDVAYDPRTICQDADYGQVSFSGSRYGNSYGDYVSPRIDVSTYDNVKLTFHLYRSTDSNTQGSFLQIGFISDDQGRELLPTRYDVYGSEDAWAEYTVEIPEKYARSNRLGIILYGYTMNYKGQVHVDNLTVTGDQSPREIKAERIIGGDLCLIGQRNTYDVEVSNIGTETVSGITVRFYADDELIGTETIESIEAGKSALAPFAITPGLDNTERPMVLRGVIECDEDGADSNNTVESTVQLTAPMLPYVTEISGASRSTTSAHIAWEEPVKYPHAETVTDDVDSYKPFAITGIGDWTTVDRDLQITAQISLGDGALQWENAGQPQAFIVFNTTQAGTSSVLRPHSGAQCFISFASRTQNDDWLISPRLSGDAQNISFYAKCAYTTDLNERFEIWASQSSPEIADFICISGDRPIAVTSYNDWIRYSFSLPEGTKYFAIRCVSKQQTGLMIDDITYSPAHPALELWGFNIYRDGVKITPSEHPDFEYTDEGLEFGRTYTYAVSAVYDAGESIFSPAVEVKVDGTSSITDVTTDAASADDVIITPAYHAISITAPEGTPISVVTVDGKLLYHITSCGQQTIPVAPGIYVVNAAATSAKVMVK